MKIEICKNSQNPEKIIENSWKFLKNETKILKNPKNPENSIENP